MQSIPWRVFFYTCNEQIPAPKQQALHRLHALVRHVLPLLLLPVDWSDPLVLRDRTAYCGQKFYHHVTESTWAKILLRVLKLPLKMPLCIDLRFPKKTWDTEHSYQCIALTVQFLDALQKATGILLYVSERNCLLVLSSCVINLVPPLPGFDKKWLTCRTAVIKIQCFGLQKGGNDFQHSP